jgi:hypothetical protein
VKLYFSEVDDVLRRLHRIEPEDASSFRSRLKNLLRVGLTIAPLEGGGRKKNYPASSVLKLGFAVELLQAGLPPERAAILTAAMWSTVAAELLKARADMRANRRSPRWLVSEHGLLSASGFPRVRQFRVMSADDFATFVSDKDASTLQYRLLAINLAGFLGRTIIAFKEAGLDPNGLLTEMDEAPAAAMNPHHAQSGFAGGDDASDS